MTQQEREIKTIAPRTYTLKLSEADCNRLAVNAGKYGLTAEQLLEEFIGDLVCGTYHNGSDETSKADEWAERCWFALEPERTLIQFLCTDYPFSDIYSFFDEEDLEEIKEEYLEYSGKDEECWDEEFQKFKSWCLAELFTR